MPGCLADWLVYLGNFLLRMIPHLGWDQKLEKLSGAAAAVGHHAAHPKVGMDRLILKKKIWGESMTGKI